MRQALITTPPIFAQCFARADLQYLPAWHTAVNLEAVSAVIVYDFLNTKESEVYNRTSQNVMGYTLFLCLLVLQITQEYTLYNRK